MVINAALRHRTRPREFDLMLMAIKSTRRYPACARFSLSMSNFFI
jgi:hypothetical protein